MTTLRARRPSSRLLATGVLLAVLLGCGQEAEPPDLPPRSIKWHRVSGSLEGERRVISGIVTSVDDTLLAFEVAGTVHTVEVDLGDNVEKDAVLARLDPEPFDLAVHDAQSAVAETTALLEEARASLARYVEAGRAVSKQQVDRATALRDARESQLEAARARLGLAQRDRRLSVLRAPFQGSISVRSVEPAMRVAGGQTVFEMDSEESGLRVEVQMPETLIARVRQGQEVSVTFPSGDARSELADRTFEAVVSEVGTRAGTGNAFPVSADLRSRPDGVRPGMTAEVTFSLPREGGGVARFEGFMIPIAAAYAEADNQFSVFVYDPETSTVNKRPVKTGGVGDNTIAILEGLKEGDIIATAGVAFLRDGENVTLLDERLVRNAP